MVCELHVHNDCCLPVCLGVGKELSQKVLHIWQCVDSIESRSVQCSLDHTDGCVRPIVVVLRWESRNIKIVKYGHFLDQRHAERVVNPIHVFGAAVLVHDQHSCGGRHNTTVY